MIKDTLFYRTRLSNGERVGFVPGRGKTIIVDTEKYPNCAFIPGCKVDLKDKHYSILSKEMSASPTYPSMALGKVVILVVKEVKDEEKASDEERQERKVRNNHIR